MPAGQDAGMGMRPVGSYGKSSQGQAEIRGGGQQRCQRLLAVAAGKGDFVAQHIPGLFAQLHKGWGVAYLGGARTRQRYVQNGFDATGSVRHDGDAVRQIDGFIEAVGDEDDGGLVLLPDAQQLGLQDFACLGIQGGNMRRSFWMVLKK